MRFELVGGRELRLGSLVAALVVAALAHAAELGAAPVNLPAPRVQPVHGLRLSVDYDWLQLSGPGYRPVRVQLMPLAPSAADQTVTIRLRSHNPFATGSYLHSVQQDIEIPAGAASAGATVLLPEYQDSASLSWDVWVDGSYARELSQEPDYWSRGAMSGGEVRVLVVTDDVLKGTQLAAQFSRFLPGGASPAWSRMRTYGPSSGGIDAGVVGTADLADRWLHYSLADAIYISWPELSALGQQNPATWRAIRRWINAGGELWVCDVGSQWQRLPELESLFDLPVEAEASPLKRGWRGPPALPPIAAREYDYAYPEAAYDSETPPDDLVEAGPLPDRRVPPKLLMRDVHFGQLVALAEKDPFDRIERGEETTKTWSFAETADTHRMMPTLRYGADFSSGLPEFWNFTIPGVGLAPVTEFLVIISLFVLVIGPVNYVLLRRLVRLHLLLFTVPLGAALLTAGLFGYALLTDGLGARVRVRSLTVLDQRTGQASSWARQSYYCGLAPRGGLRFSEQTAVYPLVNQEGSFRYRYGLTSLISARDTEWVDSDSGRGEQRLPRGWLSARTPTQYLVIRSEPIDEKLVVRETTGGIEVDNRLGTSIEQLVLRGRRGGYFWGEQIEPGATAVLERADRNDLFPRLARSFGDRAPAFPAEMSKLNRNNLMGGNSYYYDSGDRYFDYSRLEQGLAAILKDEQESSVAAGSYVAIVGRSPHLELGLSKVTEEGSFHVILGYW